MDNYIEYEILAAKVLISGEASTEDIGDVTTYEDSGITKTINRKSKGLIIGKVVKETGEYELTRGGHFTYSTLQKLLGKDSDLLESGYYGAGTGAHPTFVLTEKRADENGNVILKAFPYCIVTSGDVISADASAEDLADAELSIYAMRDENGFGSYEHIMDGNEVEGFETSWMDSFSYDLVKVVV